MKLKIAIAILCLLALTVASAYAATVRISESNFGALGWTRTLRQGGSESGQSCNFRAELPAGDIGDGVHPSPKKSDTGYSWAGLSAQIFQGRLISTITTFEIRTMGYEGDGAEWEPAALWLGLAKGAGANYRGMRALPYATFGRGTANTYYVYNMMTCKYFCETAADAIKSLNDFVVQYPDLSFASNVLMAAQTAPPSKQNFNVFDGTTSAKDKKYGSSARGTVDWVHIAFNDGSDYIFDFVVPEPSSILALFTGVVGMLALRRRR